MLKAVKISLPFNLIDIWELLKGEHAHEKEMKIIILDRKNLTPPIACSPSGSFSIYAILQAWANRIDGET